MTYEDHKEARATELENEVLRLQTLTGPARDAAAPQFLASMAGFVRKRVRWFFGPDVDAAELEQVAHAALWRAVLEWRPDGGRRFLSFARWGCRQALEAHLSASRPVRTKLRCHAVPIEDIDEPEADADQDPLAQLLQAERVTNLRTALARLPEQHRTVLERRLAGERVRDVGRRAWEEAAAALRMELRRITRRKENET